MMQRKEKGKTPIEIHEWLSSTRGRLGIEVPDITNVRKALKGKAYRRGAVDGRGRKPKLTTKKIRKLNASRRSLIKKRKGEDEVHWHDVLKKARVKVHATTAKRSMQKAGFDVVWRMVRERPQRTGEHEQKRMELAGNLRRRPLTYFTQDLDLIMDNKKFMVPANAQGKRHMKMRKVRGVLRTRQEGLEKGFTKPNMRKNRINTGGMLDVCGGIMNNKVVLWEYLPKKWNGEVAKDLYKGAVYKALRKNRGVKRTYKVLEDNDPSGYKSKKAIDAKKALGITAMAFPPYSPDLNPLDFYIWHEVETRAMKKVKGPMSVKKYKALLRRVALALPEAAVMKAVAHIKVRAQAVYDARGGDIDID